VLSAQHGYNKKPVVLFALLYEYRTVAIKTVVWNSDGQLAIPDISFLTNFGSAEPIILRAVAYDQLKVEESLILGLQYRCDIAYTIG